MKKTTLMFAGLLVALATLPAMAGPGHHGMMLRNCLRKAKVTLTAAQRDKIRIIKDEIRLKRDKFRPKMRKLREKMLKTFTDLSLSDAKVKSLMKQNKARLQQIMEPVMDKILKIRHILTKAQLQKIANTPGCMEPDFDRGRHGRMGPGCRCMHGMGRSMHGMGK